MADRAAVINDPRGRGAKRPSDIPARGWGDVLVRVWDRFFADNIMVIAAGVAFFAFLAIPATLTAFVSLYGLISDPADVEQQVSALGPVLPREAITLLSEQLRIIATNPHSTVRLGVSLLVALWSARSAMATLITAVDIAYRETEKRSLLRFELLALMMTVGAILFAVISLTIAAVSPRVVGQLPLGAFGTSMTSVIRWPLLVIVVMLAMAAVYRYAPSRQEARWSWISWGAAAGTTLWLSGSALFSMYVGELAGYDRAYGSIGAVVVLLLWLYISALSVLIGAEINAEIEYQTAS